MSIQDQYPHFAPIAHHIDAAQLGRVVMLSEGLADFLADCWKAFLAGPRPSTVIIEAPPRQYRTYAPQ
jgi:hypothetical protein